MMTGDVRIEYDEEEEVEGVSRSREEKKRIGKVMGRSSEEDKGLKELTWDRGKK